MAETVILNARVTPEIRDELNKIINRIMDENHYKKAGDAYAELVEIVKQHQSEVHPDFKEYIATIKADAQAIISSALAMNDVFIAYQNNQEQQNKAAQLGLIKQLNKLQEKTEKQAEKIKQLNKELNELILENTELKKELQKEDQISQLVASVNELINKDNKNEESEVLENQMTIEDYNNRDS